MAAELGAARQQLEQACSDQLPLAVIQDHLRACCNSLSTAIGTVIDEATSLEILSAVSTLGKVILGLAQRSPDELQSLCCDPVWIDAFLPVLETCSFPERYDTELSWKVSNPLEIRNEDSDCLAHFHPCRLHASLPQAATQASSSSLAERLQLAARDVLKDAYFKFLSNLASSASAGPSVGSLGLVLARILRMAVTAADLIGWRDPRAAKFPSLRSYGVLNALWFGVTTEWNLAPPALQAVLEDEGISAEAVVQRLISFLKDDTETMCRRIDVDGVKLLQFWLVQIRKLVGVSNAAAKTAFAGLAKWACTSRGKVAVATAGSSGPATALRSAVHAGSLWSRGAKVMVACLNDLQPSEAEQAVAALVGTLQGHCAGGQPEAAFDGVSCVLELLNHAAPMPPATRRACLPALDAVFTAVTTAECAPAVSSPMQLSLVADAALVFIATCSAAAAEADARSFDIELAEDCQLCLLKHSMCPHPILLGVLSMVWASLAAISEGPAVKQWIASLHELLVAVAATEAAAPAFLPPSPIHTQLVSLLSTLLATAPQPMAEGFFRHKLRCSAEELGDTCQVAGMAALLRAGATAGAHVPPGDALEKVLSVLVGWLRQGGAKADDLLKSDAAKEEQSLHALQLHLAWVAEAVSAGIQCLAASNTAPLSVIQSAVDAALVLLSQDSAANAPYLMPMLRLLCTAVDANSLAVSSPQFEDLQHRLVTFMAVPAAAAQVASFARAYGRCASAPVRLFAALLSSPPSPALRLLGIDAYADYIRTCDQASMLTVLPPALRDPATGAMSDPFKATMERYLRRTVTASERRGHNDGAEVWAKAAEEQAQNLPQLLHGLMASAPRAVAYNFEGPAGSEHQVDAILTAVEGVAASVQRLHAVRAELGRQRAWSAVEEGLLRKAHNSLAMMLA